MNTPLTPPSANGFTGLWYVAFNFEIISFIAFSDGDPFHRNTPSNKTKCTITIEEMITLMKQYMAINKGKNIDVQKSDGVGITLLEKIW